MISQVFPEPIRDIEAQVDALHCGLKRSVYTAPNTPFIPSHSISIQRPEGILSTTEEHFARYWNDASEVSDDDIAIILGYPEAKSQIVNPVVLQARDGNDRVVMECGVSFKNILPHSEVIARYVPTGGRLVIASVLEALQRRAELR